MWTVGTSEEFAYFARKISETINYQLPKIIADSFSVDQQIISAGLQFFAVTTSSYFVIMD